MAPDGGSADRRAGRSAFDRFRQGNSINLTKAFGKRRLTYRTKAGEFANDSRAILLDQNFIHTLCNRGAAYQACKLGGSFSLLK
jgi:hypothetical protein